MSTHVRCAGMLGIMFGWKFGIPYAHSLNGSAIKRTFVGPWALARAARWTEKMRTA